VRNGVSVFSSPHPSGWRLTYHSKISREIIINEVLGQGFLMLKGTKKGRANDDPAVMLEKTLNDWAEIDKSRKIRIN